MKFSQLIFQFRYALHLVLYLLAFLAPWNYAIHLDPPGPNAHVWGLLAINLLQAHLLNITAAFDVLLVLGIAFAVAGAFLRTWGAAYLDSSVVKSDSMHTGEAVSGNLLLEDGPFRHMRNPLYVGTFLHTLALALLMPRSGAIFAILAIGGLQFLLIDGEEKFLTQKLGTAYEAYCGLVPRIWPRVLPKVKGSGLKPRWGQAFLGETYMWGVAVCYASLGWQYNAQPMLRGILIAFGASIVVRAFLPTALKPVEDPV